MPLDASRPAARSELSTAYVDTAALRYLYEPSALPGVAKAVGSDRLLFGSDYPLVSQAAALNDVRRSGLAGASLRSVLGENAERLLRRESPASQ